MSRDKKELSKLKRKKRNIAMQIDKLFWRVVHIEEHSIRLEEQFGKLDMEIFLKEKKISYCKPSRRGRKVATSPVLETAINTLSDEDKKKLMKALKDFKEGV